MSRPLRDWLGAAAARAARPRPGDRPLRVVSEWEALRLVDDVRTLEETQRSRPGAISRWSMVSDIPEAEMRERVTGRSAGEGAPPWHDGSGGGPVSGVSICRTRDAFHAPMFGAVILDDGRVLESSVVEALYMTPTLAGLPYATTTRDGVALRAPSDVPTLRAATVFMAWGGIHNYGHFLLDCLPALEAATDGAVSGAPPPIAPVLTEWQREVLDAYFGEAGRVQEIAAPLVRVGDLIFATPMNHFLHAPAPPLDRVRERLLAAADPAPTGLARLYISRRGDEKREMVNEAELEAELEARGFTVVQAAAMPFREQVRLFRDAEVIVAPTGAALANTLFCRPGAKVFEIQPTNFTGIWVRGVCHLVGADWHGYFAPSPLEETEIYLEGQRRPGVLFAWRTPLAEFLSFLDERL